MSEERFNYEVDDATRFVDNLKDRVHDLYDKNVELKEEVQRLNNKLELISTLVEREFPPNEFITYKMKKILKGVDKE